MPSFTLKTIETWRVRVAGFSALFIELDKGVQDEIIKRTEQLSVN